MFLSCRNRSSQSLYTLVLTAFSLWLRTLTLMSVSIAVRYYVNPNYAEQLDDTVTACPAFHGCKTLGQPTVSLLSRS